MAGQVFNIYTGKGYAGQEADTTNAIKQTGVAVGDIEFGVAVARDAAVDRGVSPSADANVYAVALREWNHEASTKPSDGTTVYASSQSVSLIRQGYVYVEFVGAIAAGGTIYVDAAGSFSGAAGGTVVTNMYAEQAASAGEVAKVRLDIVHA